MGTIIRSALAILLLMILTASLGWLFRLELAGWVLTRALAEQGYPQARLEVTELTLRQTTLREIELRPVRGPAAAQVEFRYTPRALLNGERSEMDVLIRGLSMRLEPDDEATDTAAESPAPEAEAIIERLAPLVDFSRLAVRNGEVVIATSRLGVWRIDFEGSLHGGEQGLRRAQLHGEAVAEPADLRFDLGLLYEAGALRGSIAYADRVDGFDVHADLRLRPPWNDPTAEIDHRVRIDGDAGPAPQWWPLPWPTTGSLRVTGEHRGRIGSMALPGDFAQTLRRLEQGGWRGSLRARGDHLGIDEQIQGVRAMADGEWALRDDTLQLAVSGDGGLAIDGLHVAEARRLPLPLTIGEALIETPARITWPAATVLALEYGDEGVVLALTPEATLTRPDDPFRLHWSGRGSWRLGERLRPEHFTVEVDDFTSAPLAIRRLRATGELDDPQTPIRLSADLPRLAIAPLQVRDTTVDLALLRTQSGRTDTRFNLVPGGRITAATVAWPPALESASAVAAVVTGGAFQSGVEPEWSLWLAAAGAAWRTELADGTALDLALAPHELRLSGPSALLPLARATLGDVDIVVTEPALRADGVALDLRPGRVEGWARFAAQALHVDAAPLPLTPIQLRGQVDNWSDEGHRLHGEGQMANGRARLDFTAGRLVENGTPHLQVDWPDLAFTPQGLQPDDLSPRLGAVSDVAGAVSVGALLPLAGNRLDGRARLRSEGLDFALGAARIRGLTGDIALAGLMPLRSDGDQRLDADHLRLGLGLDDPRIRFAVEPAAGAKSEVEIREAAADYAGDRLFMRPWTFRPGADEHAVTLEAGPVELATLVEDLQLVDVAASGRISGRVPLSWVDGRILIEDAELGGNDGRIAFRADTDTAPWTAAARAFGDLTYERLDIAIDQPRQRIDTVTIRADGRNPAIADGERQRHHIALGGDLGPLIEAILAGKAITREMLDRQLAPIEPP